MTSAFRYTDTKSDTNTTENMTSEQTICQMAL